MIDFIGDIIPMILCYSKLYREELREELAKVGISTKKTTSKPDLVTMVNEKFGKDKLVSYNDYAHFFKKESQLMSLDIHLSQM